MAERLTQSDIEKIQAEIRERKLVKRPELIAAVKEARAHGDLSENFEYHAAKREKNQNESRIRYLENMLKGAVVVSDKSETGVVGMINTVTVYIPEDDETEVYKIVTSIRGNSLKGKISIESPMGKAIMGKKVGETAIVHVDDSYSYEVQIVSIDESTDDVEDEIKRF